METQSVYFKTEGTGFNSIILDFIQEGKFETVYLMLTESNPQVTNDMVIKIMNTQMKFIGEASRESDIYIVDGNENPDYKYIIYGIVHLVSKTGISYIHKDLNFKRLLNIFGNDLPKDIKHKILEYYKVKIVDKITNQGFNGVITKDGTIIECGYQEHIWLYNYLYLVGYADTSDWVDCSDTIHISSGQISGKVYASIEHPGLYEDVTISNDMLQKIWEYSEILSIYSPLPGQTVGNDIIKYYQKNLDLGGKLSNLHFLQELYKDRVKLPQFSLTEIPDVKNCLRTSPKLSLPGLLNSKFDLNENSLKEIYQDWEKYVNVRGTYKSYNGETIQSNKLTVFYQEYIEGVNGVCQIINDKFGVQASVNRGDIVNGKPGNYKISEEHFDFLHTLAKEIKNKTKKDVQFEFVIDQRNQLYILQMRIMENKYDDKVIVPNKHLIKFKGTSFCKGYAKNLELSDILIIRNDIDSPEKIINKKALIVTEDVEFSHALALSRALNIPSIYGVGDIHIPKNSVISVNTTDNVGYILKSQK